MSCVGFDSTDFTIKVEAKATLGIVLSHRLFACGGFFYTVCLYVLSNICSH